MHQGASISMKFHAVCQSKYPETKHNGGEILRYNTLLENSDHKTRLERAEFVFVSLVKDLACRVEMARPDNSVQFR